MWRKAHDSKPGALPSSVSSTQQPAAPQDARNTSAAAGQGIKIKGEVSGHGDLFLDGEFEGRICIASGTLTVGSNARVRAEIEASEIIIRGDVIGSLKASERVHIWSTGKLMGDIETRAIVIDDGAVLKSMVGAPRDSVRQGTPPEGSLSETDHPPQPSSAQPPPRAKGASA